MDWKDNGRRYSEARTANGKYRITCWGAYYFKVQYRASGDSNWTDVRYPWGVTRTFAEAKRMAEEDEERRRKSKGRSRTRDD